MLSSTATLPPAVTRPHRQLDRHAARADRLPDDGGLSQPKPGRPAGSLHADARGLRAGGQPAHAHRQSPPAAGQLPQTQRGLLPHRRPQAVRQQADGPEPVPYGHQLPHLCSCNAQRAASVHLLQYPQKLLAEVATIRGRVTHPV